jgi:hypothetical protein
MANKARGEVTLELDGETYVLVPSFGAVCEIEDKTGANLFNLGRRLELAEISARDLIDLAHACLAPVGYTGDKAHLGEAIVEAGTLKVIAALTEFCRNYAFGGQDEKKDAAAETEATPETAATVTETPSAATSSGSA